jgi:hypothetical protein
MATCRQAGGLPLDRGSQMPQTNKKDPDISLVCWDDETRHCWLVLSVV